jgi:predicted esterase
MHGRAAGGFQGMSNTASTIQSPATRRCHKNSVRRLNAFVLLAFTLGAAWPALADEPAILKNIKTFFDTNESTQRKDLATAIAADEAYDRSKMRDWLHAAGLFKKLEPGRTLIQTGIGSVKALPVTIRVPKEYDAAHPYPLIYALHGTGGDADGIIAYVEKILGPQVEQFVVAAPNGYEQVVLNAITPYTIEHRAALRDIRKTVHIDADRVYAIGYSRGGHACWTLAVTCPDEFAGIVPVAGTLLIPEYDVLFETFLPNLANTRVLCCYGAMDDGGPDGARSAAGGVAGVNRFIKKVAEPLKLPLTLDEQPDKGHGDIVPPPADLTELLNTRRAAFPKKVEQTFRVLDQGGCYWIEPREWTGKQWTDAQVQVEFKPGEKEWDEKTQRQALARAIRALLAKVKGSIDGQKVRIDRKNVKEYVIWLSEGMIDWSQPVTVNDSGNKAFDGRIEPDLLLCLTQAAETWDFERLRWAGLKCMSGKKAVVVK